MSFALEGALEPCLDRTDIVLKRVDHAAMGEREDDRSAAGACLHDPRCCRPVASPLDGIRADLALIFAGIEEDLADGDLSAGPRNEDCRAEQHLMIQGRNFSSRLDLLGALSDALGNILQLPLFTKLSPARLERVVRFRFADQLVHHLLWRFAVGVGQERLRIQHAAGPDRAVSRVLGDRVLKFRSALVDQALGRADGDVDRAPDQRRTVARKLQPSVAFHPGEALKAIKDSLMLGLVVGDEVDMLAAAGWDGVPVRAL